MPDAFAAEVLAASRDWVWVPPDAEDVVTDEYRLIHYPWYSSVQWARRPVTELLPELLDRARAAGRTTLRWWVTDGDDPEVEQALRSLRLPTAETVDVFGLDLAGVDALVARLEVPDDVRVRPADDETSLRLAGQVSSTAFEEPPPGEALLARSVGYARDGLSTGVWAQRQYLAEVGGEVVGAAGCTCIREGTHGPAGVLRLWNAGVLPHARGRGAYRGLLAERCRFGAEQGMRLALVKGRVETSGPVLRKAGFAGVGQERCYEVQVSR